MPFGCEEPPPSVVFLRHGESVWNKAGIFTGWVDVPLSEEGEEQAQMAGSYLATWGFEFDHVYTSCLQRTTRTAELVLNELEQGWDPSIVTRSWRLNERMYGALTGLNKRDVANEYGSDQFQQWVTDPPPLQRTSRFYPGNDPMYAHLPQDVLPLKESFEDCMKRVVPLWEEEIKPLVLLDMKRVLVISSRNSIRALLMHISDISTQELLTIDIPNGVPLVYEIEMDCLKTIESDTCNFGVDGPFVRSKPRYGAD
eukprot:CAMPEP_0119419466 /NCGR_PEP_ID=MMETSP1335-20130426/20947_1 /TAXON_ID=259385 /ORGANISM="Chrysoculter rhomboideus, Strain RCC1486" /LENGTH=254 /DNA_ID=CAMNT_0007444775 /DNA_START=60 /DNA_END=824 /DNA_ORIENTATION=-